MLAKKITVHRLEKKEIVHKVQLKKLSDIALNVVSANYLLYPELNNLDEKQKLRVYDKMSVNNPIEIVFPLINHEPYWQRACKEEFKAADCSFHGNSWKQCYAENYMTRLLTTYDISKGSKMEVVQKYLDLLKFHIFNLYIPTFAADFDISKIPYYFANLTTLELKYSPILRDEKKNALFNKQLTPIKEEFSKFGMRMSDLKQFSVSIGDLSYLLSLTLQGNFIDDDMLKWLVPGLISNHTLRYLDLSNNKITEKGYIILISI